MPETEPHHIIHQPRLTFRISCDSLSFSVADTTLESQLRYVPYPVKSGISIAANLREAFKDNDVLQMGYDRAMIIIDTLSLLIPTEEFNKDDAEALYHYTFPGHDNDVILTNVLPYLNCVVAFSVNKDLKLVIDDHFSDVRFQPVMQSIWDHLHEESFTGMFKKLYGYFHDKKLEIICYDKNRFKFYNAYQVKHFRDAVYFLLYVWNQLELDAQRDELHILGNIPEREALTSELKKFLRKVYYLNPSAVYNRAPIAQIKELPFDLLAYYIHKRA
ncbi:MAG: DUF3822 family protein [Prevotella sp.]|jgi:hypothetical protein|nr:DUF3822 family protein [Prevotella sp.]MCH4099986.1 DUF3822 family protein [Prevotella sp.]MCI1475135.1 DUF3822 family protein [Prevotella sp.]MCI1519280.1 DUF3822 family protein [Prevotella sp.]MCI1548713.1 DUF3822 family protein [Prevotella sp.]MCI1596633.1 DUF3822 family protein [Prevotella sp.]